MRIKYSASKSRICTKLLAFFNKTAENRKIPFSTKLLALILIAQTLILCVNNLSLNNDPEKTGPAESSYDEYSPYGKYSPSSIRWKENIAEIEGALQKIHSIRGVTYDWKADYGGQSDIGVIAEEIGWVFPEIVGYEPDGSGYAYGVDYPKMTPILLEAIKDLDEIVDAQALHIADLEARLAYLENIHQ